MHVVDVNSHCRLLGDSHNQVLMAWAMFGPNSHYEMRPNLTRTLECSHCFGLICEYLTGVPDTHLGGDWRNYFALCSVSVGTHLASLQEPGEVSYHTAKYYQNTEIFGSGSSD